MWETRACLPFMTLHLPVALVCLCGVQSVVAGKLGTVVSSQWGGHGIIIILLLINANTHHLQHAMG